jgi:hypothetical protein
MKGGVLITKGTQQDAIKQVEGKVFETTFDTSSLDEFKRKYFVVDTIRQKDKTKVRYINDTAAPSSVSLQASLEDAYLFLTKTNGKA